MKTFPKVFIVVLNFNGQRCIIRTLSSLFRVDYPNFEVILVDNNSRDGSFELAKSAFSKAVFIKNNENLGFSAGNNVGIKYALERGAEYILLLNYDVEVEKFFLAPLVEVMEGDSQIGIASPVIFFGETRKIWFSGGKIDWLRMKTFQKNSVIDKDYFGSDYICGCSMLIKKEVFKKTGILDEDYFLYWEDVDFSLKAKRAGYKLAVCPKSRIAHFEKSEEKKENKVYWLVLSGLIFFKKNTPFWLWPWIFLFLRLRKIKNWIDLKSSQKDLAPAVRKAYQDFSYVK
jgi:GT2 family glycosyltransferase